MENEITAHKAGTVAELPDRRRRLGRDRRHARRDQLRRRVPTVTRGSRGCAAWISRWRGRSAGPRAMAHRAPSMIQRPGTPRPPRGSPTCPLAVKRRAVPGDDGLRRSRRGPQPLQRLQIGIRREPRCRDPSGSRPATGSRRTRARRATGARSGAVGGVPVGRMQLELGPSAPIDSWPGTGSAWIPASPAAGGPRRSAPRRIAAARAAPSPGSAARRAAVDLAGSRATPPGTRAGPSRWSQSPWVASSPDDREAGLLEHARQRLELVRVDGRIDHEPLVAGPDRGAGRLPDAADEDDHVGVDARALARSRPSGVALA